MQHLFHVVHHCQERIIFVVAPHVVAIPWHLVGLIPFWPQFHRNSNSGSEGDLEKFSVNSGQEWIRAGNHLNWIASFWEKRPSAMFYRRTKDDIRMGTVDLWKLSVSKTSKLETPLGDHPGKNSNLDQFDNKNLQLKLWIVFAKDNCFHTIFFCAKKEQGPDYKGADNTDPSCFLILITNNDDINPHHSTMKVE